MIEVRNLVKQYGTFNALDHISFTVDHGEIVGFLGPNGAGKTTTMRILTGFMPPTSGQVNIGGFDILDNSMAVRRLVGYLPEQVPIYRDMSVRSYLMFWARLRGMRRPKQRVDEIMAQVSLSDRAGKRVASLSKGLRQRLGMAQALVHNPEVVILDEPTIGIDPQQVIEVRNLITELRGKRTVLLSSHLLNEVQQLCDRVIIINHGRILATGTPGELAHRLKPGQRIYVQTSGTGQESRRVLDKVRGLDQIMPEGQGFILKAASDTDIRESISETVLRHGLNILEMRVLEDNLEDVFVNIMQRQKG